MVALASTLENAPALAAESRLGLELVDLNGRPQTLVERAGKIVVVNFWATWCMPCREEMPLLSELEARYAPRDVEFVAASVDDDETIGAVPAAIAEAGIEFAVWTGATVDDMQRFGVGTELPATVIVDRDGSVVFRMRGAVTEATVTSRLDWLLGSRRGHSPAPSWAAAGEDPDGEEEHEEDGHDCDGHAHAHDAAADASLVPS